MSSSLGLPEALWWKVSNSNAFDMYMKNVAINYWYIFVPSAFAYLFVIRFLVAYMKLRPAYSLRGLLFLWNGALSLFSVAGAIVVVPFAIVELRRLGFQAFVCSEEWFQYPGVVFMIGLFVWSKVPELIDTVFLALRKRPIILLHWYHHFTVLLYVWWTSWHNIGGTGVIFSAMNLVVHSIMYGYYALQAVGIRPPFPIFITLLQIVQMFIGTLVVITSGSCMTYTSTYWAGLVMYSSYFILFTWFFISRYFISKKESDDVRVSKDKVF